MLIFTACGGDSDDAPEAEATPTAVVTQAETQVVEEPTPTAIIVVPPKAPLIYTPCRYLTSTTSSRPITWETET